jgi:hypothetical protein
LKKATQYLRLKSVGYLKKPKNKDFFQESLGCSDGVVIASDLKSRLPSAPLFLLVSGKSLKVGS